jgi:flavodoxin
MNRILIALAALCMANSTGAQAQENKNQSPKILVAYYSWGGNTKVIAQQIQSFVPCDVFVIEPAKPYPTTYEECVKVAKQEINDKYKPELKANIENLAQYDIVFIGTPNWWSSIAPPVVSFLSQNDLSGKIVIPFCTHGGGGRANLFKDVAELCPNSTVKEGFATSGDSAATASENIRKWLQEIGVIQ